MTHRLWLITPFLLAGCAGAPVTHSTPASSPSPVAAKPAAAPPPHVTLTRKLLFEILSGEVAMQRGDYAFATRVLTDAATRSRDPRLAARATEAAVRGRLFPQALKSARLWTQLEPDNGQARQALAEILMQLGQTQAAQVELRRIVQAAHTDPELTMAYVRVATALAGTRDRAGALKTMQSLVQLHPDRPEAQFALAHLAVRTGDLNAALAAIDHTLALRPAWEDAAVFKARVLAVSRGSEQTLAFYRDFLARHPKAAGLRLNYARYLVDLKQWEKAREQFERVAAQQPQDADALYAVGLLALQTNQLDEAEDYLKRNLALQPDNDQARLYLGQIAQQRKDYAGATKWYGDVAPGPYYFEAQARLALIEANQGRVDAALNKLRSIEPDNDAQRVQLWLAEDQILRDAGRYRDSFDMLTKALKRMPDNTDLLYARALVAERLDMLDVHERDLRRLLAKDPKNANALNALGYTLADHGIRLKEALQLIQEAIALKPDDPYIMDSLGWVHYRLGDTADAIRYLKRALAIRSDAEIAAHLGEVLWTTGDRSAAETVWAKALKESPDNRALNTVIKKFKK